MKGKSRKQNQNYLDELQTDKEKQLQDVETLQKGDEFAIDLDDSSSDDQLQPLLQNTVKQLRSLQRMREKNQLSLENAFSVELPEHIRLAQQSDFKKSSIYLSSLAWLYGVRVDSTLRDTFKVKLGILRIHGVDQAGNTENFEVQKKHAASHVNEKPQQQSKVTTRRNLYQYGESTLDKNPQSLQVKSYDTIQLNPFFHQTGSKLDQQQLSSMLLYKPMFTEDLKMIIDPDQLTAKDDDAPKDVYGIKIEFNFQEPLQCNYWNLIEGDFSKIQDEPIFNEILKIKEDLQREGKRQQVSVNFSSAPSLQKKEAESINVTDWNQYFEQIEFYNHHFSTDQSWNYHTSDIKMSDLKQLEEIPNLSEVPQEEMKFPQEEENQNWQFIDQQQSEMIQDNKISNIGNYDLIQFENPQLLEEEEKRLEQEQQEQQQQKPEPQELQQLAEEEVKINNDQQQEDQLNEQEIENYFNEQIEDVELEAHYGKIIKLSDQISYQQSKLFKKHFTIEDEEEQNCLNFSKIKLLQVMKLTDNEKIRDLMEVVEERNYQRLSGIQPVQKFHFEKQKPKSNVKRGDKKNINQSVKWDFMDIDDFDRSILGIKKVVQKNLKNTISIKHVENQGVEYRKENLFEYFLRGFGGEVVDEEEMEDNEEPEQQQWLYEEQFQIQEQYEFSEVQHPVQEMIQQLNKPENESTTLQQQQDRISNEQQKIVLHSETKIVEIGQPKSPSHQKAVLQEEADDQIVGGQDAQKLDQIIERSEPRQVSQQKIEYQQDQQQQQLQQQYQSDVHSNHQMDQSQQEPQIEFQSKIEHEEVVSVKISKKLYPPYFTTFKVVQNENQKSSQIPIKVLKQCVMKIIGPMLERNEQVSFLRTYNSLSQIFPVSHQQITINQLFISFLFLANDEGYMLKRQERFLEKETEFVIRQK